MNTALGRSEVALLTNKSGGSVAQGDVVIVDATTAASFTTTTTSAYVDGRIGVVIEPNGIASNELGMVAFVGYVPKINLSGSASLGDLVKTHTVAKQGVRHAAPAEAGDFAQVLGTGTTPAALLYGTVQLGGVTGETGRIPNDGWTADSNTWTYSSVDAPTGIVSINADMTGILQVGMRIKFTQTTVKYFIVTAVGAFGGGATLVTLYGGTDYTLANAAITSPYYSSVKAPFGFSVDPSKWTASVTSGSIIQMNSNSPAASTWYNSISLSIPIGEWVIHYDVIMQTAKSNAVQDVKSTLSTANNSESSNDNTVYHYHSSTNIAGFMVTHNKRILLTLAAKATYYLNHLTTVASLTVLQTRGDVAPTKITAVCAYL